MCLLRANLLRFSYLKLTKKLLNLAILRIIFNHNDKATLAPVFAEVEKCNKILYQYDAINMVVWIMDELRSKKIAIVTSNLAKIQLERTMYN